jgi:hypothetical protein
MNKPVKFKKITSDQFDITTMETGRVNKIRFLWKLFPYGITGVEPYVKHFIKAWIHHRFGKLIIKARLMREDGWK